MSNKKRVYLLLISWVWRLIENAGWEVPFMCKVHKKLMVSSGSNSGVDEISTQEKCENSLKGNKDHDKKSWNKVS